MTDQQKRATLKAIAATGAAVTVPGILQADVKMLDGGLPPQLQIDILAGAGVPGDSVILKNTSAQALTIDFFKPGIVVYKDSMLNLNELCADGPLMLQPGQIISKTIAEWQLLATPKLESYLLADAAAESVSATMDQLKLAATLKRSRAQVVMAQVAIS